MKHDMHNNCFRKDFPPVRNGEFLGKLLDFLSHLFSTKITLGQSNLQSSRTVHLVVVFDKTLKIINRILEANVG